MFKNFLEKAKSAIDDIDVAITKVQQQTKGKKFEYDASYFTFILEGGPLHTSQLNAIARVRAGERAGELIPLNCRWFISSLDDKMIEVDGLSGPTYQPCAEDVGSRISVQALPALDGTYMGIPVYGEVGPIVLDKAVEEKVMGCLNDTTHEFKVVIEEIRVDGEPQALNLPCPGAIILNKEGKTLDLYSAHGEENRQKLSSCQYSDQYPSIEFVRKTTYQFELQLTSSHVVKLAAESNIHRDVLALALRMFGNDDLHNQLDEVEEEREQEKIERDIKSRKRTGSSNLEILMKREKLIKQTKQLEKDNEGLRKELGAEKESKSKLESQVIELKTKIEENTVSIAALQEEIKVLNSNKDNLEGEKIYLLQEVKFARSQLTELETVIKGYEAHSVKSKESLEKEVISLENDEMIKELKSKLAKVEIDSEQLQQDKDSLTKQIANLQSDLETKDANVNSLRRKIQSLVQENEKISSMKFNDSDPRSPTLLNRAQTQPQAVSQHPSFTIVPSEVESPLNSKSGSPRRANTEATVDTSKLQNYEEEIKNLKQANEKLTSTLETMKVAQNSPSKKKAGLFDLIGSKSDNTDYLQKLVNTLTETIAEKDLALENQKKINKELIKKVSDIEKK